MEQQRTAEGSGLLKAAEIVRARTAEGSGQEEVENGTFTLSYRGQAFEPNTKPITTSRCRISHPIERPTKFEITDAFSFSDGPDPPTCATEKK